MRLAVGDVVTVDILETPKDKPARMIRATGVVEDFDLPEQPPGVFVRLIRPVNGSSNYYVHRERVRLHADQP